MSPLPSLESGRRLHSLTLTIPGADVPDGLGGFTPGPATTVGPLLGDIAPASARNAERILSAVVLASASHLVRVPYPRDVPALTRPALQRASLVFHDPAAGDRTFAIVDAVDLEERHVVLILACTEAL
jgi:hypothetical protein